MIRPLSSGRLARHRPLADINVTPLVDVMLVLLVVFMITAPMLAAGLHVRLPQADAARPVEQRPPVVITVAADGSLTIGDEPVTPATLAAAVEIRLGGDHGRAVHLRADRTVDYGTVVEIMDRLATSGITRIAFLTDRQTPRVEPARERALTAATADGGGARP